MGVIQVTRFKVINDQEVGDQEVGDRIKVPVYIRQTSP